MAMFDPSSRRPVRYQQFVRPVPAWFPSARFGVFVHWGAYSVPAWAIPLGEHGTAHEDWFLRNPYAEWYTNTIRIHGSPAAAHQRDVWGGAPYDAFLDEWHAEAFDPRAMIELFARAGAGYVVPTTKHHEGIALWDAPGTGDRNTVHRGPRRDLVREFERATRAAGLRFGVYYSVRVAHPHQDPRAVHARGERPVLRQPRPGADALHDPGARHHPRRP